jgi:hypothetical protein
LVVLLLVATGSADLLLAFLSGPNDDRQSSAPAQPSLNVFDGRWTFTSAGCKYTGTLSATIKQGRVIVRGRGGQVDPDGTLHTVGAGA